MAKTQIDLLADYIMAEIPGEPSQSEGAGDTAIRVITTLRAQLADAKAANTKLEQEASQALQWLEKVISKAPHCTLRYDAEQFIKERKEA